MLPNYLKFNETQLKDATFQTLISTKWIPFYPNSRISAAFQFAANIHNLKDVFKAWEVEKRRREDGELKHIEKEIYELLEREGGGVPIESGG